MKKVILIPFLLVTMISMAQIKYDDGPIGAGNNFVLHGSWNRTNITYFFQNGTTDIVDNNERNAVRQAFQLWADYAPFTFTEVNSLAADIVIIWTEGNHGDGWSFDGSPATNNVLAHAFLPPADNNNAFPGDIHFDDAETWTLNERPMFSGQPIDLVTVAAHEIGHALGLGHSDVTCALMYPFYNGSHRYLAQDDIDGIRSLYGTRSPITSLNASCRGGTYFINNLPTGATVHWQSSNTAIATVIDSSNYGIVTRTNANDGQITLSATIQLPCGVSTESVIRNYGKPVIYSGYYTWTNYPHELPMGLVEGGSGINTVCYTRPSTTMNTLMDIRGASSVKWNPDFAPSGLIWSQSGNNLIITFRTASQTGDFLLTATNSCGTVSKFYSFQAVNCTSLSGTDNQDAAKEPVKLSPNPATGYVNIVVNDQPITAVRIYDVMGRLRKSQPGNRSTLVQVNVSDLANGIYFVEIFNGKNKIRKTLRIMH